MPFISITQQTAGEYRKFLGDAAVLEHHSSAEIDDPDEYDTETTCARLASENWDAPIVVTTTVQLFDSLFSNRTGATRKLHNLAKSVIILDEAQALPADAAGADPGRVARPFGKTTVPVWCCPPLPSQPFR